MAPPGHPFEALYTIEEKRILAWPEQAIPDEIPADVRKHALAGKDIHEFFETKEVWFWTQEGVREVLDFIESHNSKARSSETLWIVYYDLYFEHQGRHSFSHNLTHGFTAPGYWYGNEMREDYLRDDPEYKSAVFWLWFERGGKPQDNSFGRPRGCLTAVVISLLHWVKNVT